jgi:hypothetical protein
MLSNEISCAASVKAKTCPVSSFGMKPLGMIVNRYAVATRVSTKTASVKRACRMAALSDQSYAPSMPEKTRSEAV